jgi:hypothetical protein
MKRYNKIIALYILKGLSNYEKGYLCHSLSHLPLIHMAANIIQPQRNQRKKLSQRENNIPYKQ